VVVGDDPLVPTGDGATPLTPDERAELVASWVRTRGDLNRAEAEAIAAVQRDTLDGSRHWRCSSTTCG
jgi:hypothetical protein